jgi:hypothetical protein
MGRVVWWLVVTLALLLAVTGSATANVWEPPQRLGSEPAGQSSGTAPAIAVSTAGDALALYEQGANLEAAFRPRGQGWGAPQVLATAEPNHRFQWLFAGFEPSGAAVAAWVGDQGVNFALGSATRGTDGRWTAPQTVLTQAAPRMHAFGAGPRGDVGYVWDTGGPGDRILGVVRPPGGPWGATEPVSEQTDGLIDSPGIAFDGQGNAVAFWDVYQQPSEVAFRPAGGGWGAPQTLTGNPHQPNGLGLPNVAFESAGGALAVWRDAGALQAAFRPAGGDFGPPQVLSQAANQPSGTGYFVPAQIGFDAAGAAAVLWSEANPAAGSGARRLWLADRPPGGSFGAPQPVTPASENAWSGGLAVEPDGTALVLAGVRPEGPGTTSGLGTLVAYTRPPGGSFDGGTTLAAGGASGPTLASGAGEAAAAWQRSAGGCLASEASLWSASPLAAPALTACGQTAPPTGPPHDTAAPRITLTAPRRERALKTGRVTLAVSCNEDCTLVARGRLLSGAKGKLRSVKRVVHKRRRARLALKLPTRAIAARRATATVAVTATDSAGNKRTAKRKVALTH